MNEETKHIEQLPAEEPIAQAFADATSEDLLTDSLQPLLEEAQEGYTPVAVQPYTSPVAELPAAVKTLIRTVVRRPLAMLADRGTSRRTSLLDALLNTWNALRARLAGDAAFGIPDRRNEMKGLSLSSASELLKDRRLSDGIMLTTAADGHSAPVGDDTDITRPLPDGLSLAQLLCSTPANLVTEIVDTNRGWDYANIPRLTNVFTKLNKVQLNCKRIGGYSYSYNVWFPSNPESIQMDSLERFEGSAYIGFPSLSPKYKIWSFPKLYWSRTSFAHSYNSDDGFVVDWVEQVLLPSCHQLGEYASNVCLCNFTNMWKLTLGNFYVYGYSVGFLRNDPKLIHLEFGANGELQSYSLGLANWSPTNALNAELSDLVEDPEAHPDWNNLTQFLSNFREYIILRLANRKGTTALTLTLSAAVYAAVTGDTRTLADLGITADDLTPTETAAGITTDTLFNSWLDTYRAAINWTIASA